MKALTRTYESKGSRRWLDLLGRTLWRTPGSFRIARWLGPHYSLRCVLFHHVADSETAFTRGLGVTTRRENFESVLKFITKYYTPVRLQDVLAESDSHRLPPRPVLVTFDDAYASVREVAAPMCQKYGVPAVFFVNAVFLDNRQLAFDNLVCYVANVVGLHAINAAANGLFVARSIDLGSVKDVFNYFVPALSLSEREAFHKALIAQLKTPESRLASQAQLYLTSRQLQDLAAFDFEIGNHTYSHVNCRHLTRQDLAGEIDRNKKELQALSGQDVRSFSVPYGCSEDLPNELVVHLQHTGHQAAFLVESVANPSRADHFGFNRVSIKAVGEAALFSEIEILPRFRAMRRWLSTNSQHAGISRLEPAN